MHGNEISTFPANQIPFANAGPDKIITLPLDSAVLDGRGSADYDGKIVVYGWRKISGPLSYQIKKIDSSTTIITRLVTGIYQIELTVRDNGWLINKDTVQITVNAIQPPVACNMSLIPLGNLSIPRIQVAMGAAGNKILFAGGVAATFGATPALSRVDIYDKVTNNWSIAELSEARIQMAVASTGNKIFFAGGIKNNGEFSSRVDIYDAAVNTWSIAELSVARYMIAGASLGNKVFFAGGIAHNQVSDVVDIYDVPGKVWSTNFLSSPKAGLTATSLSNKIYFAGEGSNNVIVYNGSSGSWSSIKMLEDKTEVISISSGNVVMWAGGYADYGNGLEDSRKVEVYNVSDGSHTYHDFTNGGAVVYYQAATKNNKILFVMAAGMQNTLEMYDVTSHTWSVCTQYLPEAKMFTSGNDIYMAGGVDANHSISSQVWVLDF
ncbi:MAG TPA: hypothetical protein VMY77_01005 [Chitinophagaceae bacterium]|nr:hypothetical protein [Chitinophagaceae bacterium]